MKDVINLAIEYSDFKSREKGVSDDSVIKTGYN